MPPRLPVRLDTLRSRFNEICVERTGRRIDMDVAGATFATWHPEYLLTGYSWDALTAGCLLRGAGPPASILVLGLAGGTATRQLRQMLPDCAITAVEIDPAVIRLGRRYMELDAQQLEVITGDAYAFVDATPRRFDVIADDIYLTGRTDVHRPVAWTAGLVRRMAGRLAPGGILVANFIVDVGHDRLYEQAVAHFDRQFAQVAVVAPPRGFNRILVGGDRLQDPTILRRYGDRLGRRDRDVWARLRTELRRHPAPRQ